MTRIGLLSDTHGYLHPGIFSHFGAVDEIWHAGDIGGGVALADQLEAFKPFRAVYGNIDGAEIRIRYPEDLRFTLEGVAVWMTHIGGYPGRYAPRVKPLIHARPPQLFISGHSHILKVMPDKKLNLLHLNPGACGLQGWHKVQTLLRFALDKGRVEQLEVIELPRL
ncbi:metallophosphoesterase family protein [Compostibacter hankyongensis]|uniref:Metallophosphoesterase family protein n=1 Tax=Compostibacter hankyongensis TaxID=1007089 RepID=A0ABP8G8R1_9BACT